MRMDHHTASTRETRNSLEQFTRATDRKSRRKTITDTTTGAAVPLFEQRHCLVNRIVSLFLQSRWNFVAFVHHALADRRAKSGFFNDLEHFSGVVDSLHRERARSAAFNQLRNTETRRSCDRSSRVGRLHGPNALLQPVDKCEII